MGIPISKVFQMEEVVNVQKVVNRLNEMKPKKGLLESLMRQIRTLLGIKDGNQITIMKDKWEVKRGSKSG